MHEIFSHRVPPLVRFVSDWAECLWFHGLRWWGSNELKWFSICYTERGSILPLLSPHSSSNPAKSLSASQLQEWEDWIDNTATNFQLSSCFWMKSASRFSIFPASAWKRARFLHGLLKFHHLLPTEDWEQKITYTNKNVQSNSCLTFQTETRLHVSDHGPCLLPLPLPGALGVN